MDLNGKYLFGVCKIGEKGQIVIPKEAREVFSLKPGDSLVMMGDVRKGIALVKTEVFSANVEEVFSDGDKK
jgi:AbrB family looped-hinge helix DNA binding protein